VVNDIHGEPLERGVDSCGLIWISSVTDQARHLSPTAISPVQAEKAKPNDTRPEQAFNVKIFAIKELDCPQTLVSP